GIGTVELGDGSARGKQPRSDAAAQHGLGSAQLCCEAHSNEAWLPRGVEAVALRPRVANAVTVCSTISCQRTPELRPAVLAVQNVIKHGHATAVSAVACRSRSVRTRVQA